MMGSIILNKEIENPCLSIILLTTEGVFLTIACLSNPNYSWHGISKEIDVKI
jgi:hypothetical protein